MLLTNKEFAHNVVSNYGDKIKIKTREAALTIEQWLMTVNPDDSMTGNVFITI